MSLAAWFVIVPTLSYAGAASVYAWQKNWPMVIVYSGYAFANTGLLLIDIQAK